LKLLLPFARRLLGIPPRRFRSELATNWLPLSDGVRLATTVIRPLAGGAARVPAVLLRTPSRAHSASDPTLLLARILAESGYIVAVQECRGRYASEGRFTPFESEARDGRETIDWIAEQDWFDGSLGLVGFGYAGFAAWAALCGAAKHVSAMVVAFGAREPHASFHPGGAFALAEGLRWGAGIGEREAVARRRLDLARGLAFRPVRDADRVTLRSLDWFRDWVDHPRRDAFWRALEPQLPAAPPPTLLIAGWYHSALGPQLDDYTALERASRSSGSPPPELLVGPWFDAPGRAGEKPRRATRALGDGLRACITFLDRHLQGIGECGAPVRLFVRGENLWRDARAWPVPGAEERAYYLHSGGRANSLAGDGRLSTEPPATDEPPDRFIYDPADPVPTLGGTPEGSRSGAADQRPAESRGDVLCYTTPALTEDLELTGPVHAVLFAASSAPDTDFTAKLVDVRPDGRAVELCDGVLRCRWRDGGESPRWLEPDQPQRIEIDLRATSVRLRAGHRIRLEISSSNFPRFDRNPNSRTEPALAAPEQCVPAEQLVHHDGPRPSHVILPVVPQR
jgi:putative CocE/NonD family hydrolase